MFKLRTDERVKGLIDLEIAVSGDLYLKDVKSGGTGYDFRPHVAYEWDADLMGDTQASGTRISGRGKADETDGARNLHASLDDFPQVSGGQALEAVRARVKADSVVHSDREIVSGTPVFRGTRVPIDILFEFLAAGENVDEFVDCFPTVSREQAVEALTVAQRALESVAYETAS